MNGEEQTPQLVYSRGAELLMRAGTSAMAGLVVSLGYIVAGPADDETAALCTIIGLSSIMLVLIFWGVGRTEGSKTRALIEEKWAGMDLRLEVQAQALRAEIRSAERPGEAVRVAVEEAIDKMRGELHEEIAALVIHGIHEGGNVRPMQRRPAS